MGNTALLHLYISGAAWLVPTVHLLIGIGAVGLAQISYTRYKRLKQSAIKGVSSQASVPQAAH